MKKRVLSLVFALMLLISALPASACADGYSKFSLGYYSVDSYVKMQNYLGLVVPMGTTMYNVKKNDEFYLIKAWSGVYGDAPQVHILSGKSKGIEGTTSGSALYFTGESYL